MEEYKYLFCFQQLHFATNLILYWFSKLYSSFYINGLLDDDNVKFCGISNISKESAASSLVL